MLRRFFRSPHLQYPLVRFQDEEIDVVFGSKLGSSGGLLSDSDEEDDMSEGFEVSYRGSNDSINGRQQGHAED